MFVDFGTVKWFRDISIPYNNYFLLNAMPLAERNDCKIFNLFFSKLCFLNWATIFLENYWTDFFFLCLINIIIVLKSIYFFNSIFSYIITIVVVFFYKGKLILKIRKSRHLCNTELHHGVKPSFSTTYYITDHFTTPKISIYFYFMSFYSICFL